MEALIILQQPLEVIEFDLRALRIAKAAAQFLQNPARPLHIDFTGNLHRQVVTEFAPMQRPSQRIVLIAAALLPPGAIAGAVALAVPIALLHRFGETLGALAQRIQCLALRIHGTVRIALAELATGVTHRIVGLAETILAVAGLWIAVLTLLALLALLALLPLLAALALPHAALGKLFLQFLEPIAQALLILLQVAHALVALAALPVAPRILALFEGLVAQLLLLADHVAEVIQRLLHVAVAGLARLRHLQVFQHLLQLIEQLFGRILAAGAGQRPH